MGTTGTPGVSPNVPAHTGEVPGWHYEQVEGQKANIKKGMTVQVINSHIKELNGKTGKVFAPSKNSARWYVKMVNEKLPRSFLEENLVPLVQGNQRRTPPPFVT